MSKMQELESKMAELRAEMKVEGSRILSEDLKPIFDKYPKLNSFGWTQYTCYFCDGDPCYFGVHTYPESLRINGKLMDDFYDEKIKDFPDWINKSTKEISNLLESVDFDTLQDIYGDHTLVTINRDGSVKQKNYTNHD